MGANENGVPATPGYLHTGDLRAVHKLLGHFLDPGALQSTVCKRCINCGSAS